jgi:hypothetical protein
MHGASTDRLDLVASWTEPFDHLDEPGREVDGSANVFEVPIHLARDARRGETPPENPRPAGRVRRGARPRPAAGAGSRRPSPGTPSWRATSSATPATAWFSTAGSGRRASGSTSTPSSRRTPRTSRERAELSIPRSDPAGGAAGRLVVPAFRWSGASGAGRAFASPAGAAAADIPRSGPWHSSGAGELVGVVLWSDVDTEPPRSCRAWSRAGGAIRLAPSAGPRRARCRAFRGRRGVRLWAPARGAQGDDRRR